MLLPWQYRRSRCQLLPGLQARVFLNILFILLQVIVPALKPPTPWQLWVAAGQMQSALHGSSVLQRACIKHGKDPVLRTCPYFNGPLEFCANFAAPTTKAPPCAEHLPCSFRLSRLAYLLGKHSCCRSYPSRKWAAGMLERRDLQLYMPCSSPGTQAHLRHKDQLPPRTMKYHLTGVERASTSVCAGRAAARAGAWGPWRAQRLHGRAWGRQSVVFGGIAAANC